MPDAQWHPQPRVQKTAITHTSIHSEAPENTRHSPRNGFNSLYALSPAIACCHRRLRIKVLSSPVGPTSLRRLDASCGRQDHTISPSASAPFVLRSIPKLTGDLNVHPALPCPGHARRCRVHRISSRVSDDRDTPLIWNETGWL